MTIVNEPGKNTSAPEAQAGASIVPRLSVDKPPAVIVSNERLYRILLFSAATLLSLLLFVPILPTMPGMGLDPSWVIGVNQAVAQGFQFGRDILFTAGPLAAVWTQAYHPQTFAVAISAGVLLAVGHTLIACWLGQRSVWPWFWLYAVAMTFLVESRDALFLIYPLMATFFVFRATRAGEGSETVRLSAAEHAMFGVIGASLGLLPVVKLSFMPLALAATVISAGFAWHSRQRRAAAMLLALFVVSLCVFWVLVGQELSNLPNYFAATYPIISGFAAAMSRQSGYLGPALFTICSLLVFWLLTMRGARLRDASSWVFAVFFAMFCFLSFKASFVRHDVHALTASSCVVIAALLPFARRSLRIELAAPPLLLAIACWTVIHTQHSETTFQYYKPLSNRLANSAVLGVQQRLAGVSNRDLYFAYLNAIRERQPLPVIEGSTDILPFDIAALIASGNRWSPRPVFQSYSAYTPGLAGLNSDYLRSDAAARTLFLGLNPIDGQYPSLADGASWPVLMSHYDLQGLAADHLVLSRGAARRAVLTEIETRRVRLGDRVDVSDHPGILFARIYFQQSPLDKLVGFLYKPSTLQLTVSLTGSEVREHRLVAGMAEAGFMLSPYIADLGDLATLWQRPDRQAQGKAVTSFRIDEGDTGLPSWEEGYTIVLYRLDVVPPAPR